MNERDKQLPIYAAALTDPGGRRKNEDAVYTCEVIETARLAARGRLYVVADGTGGQEGGQTASSLAAAIISEHYYDDEGPDLGRSLREAVGAAHQALYELAHRVKAWAEMSTTLVAAVVHEGSLLVAHVGDSRAYLVRNGRARLLTRDHVWLEDDENYGALIRWLGGARRPSVEADVTAEALQDGDVIVLCSDGLSDVVDREDMGALVNSAASPQSTARRLVEVANRRGTGDNVSVAVIRYGGSAPVSPRRRWALVGGAVGALVALAVIAILIRPRPAPFPDQDGTVEPDATRPAVEQASATPLPGQIRIDETAAPVPTESVPLAEETRLPTSTPLPGVTPTPTSGATYEGEGPTREPPAPAARPQLVNPAQGAPDLGNPINFQWAGTLGNGQAYRVTTWHATSDAVRVSDPLTSQRWSVHLPAEEAGEWRWTVSVVQGGATVVTSQRGMFWFNPLPGSGNGHGDDGDEEAPKERDEDD
jgi:protein phosphatase